MNYHLYIKELKLNKYKILIKIKIKYLRLIIL